MKNLKKYVDFLNEQESLNNQLQKAPEKGYLLPNWEDERGKNYPAHRATALAYLQREDLDTVENTDGNWYSMADIKASMISKTNESLNKFKPGSVKWSRKPGRWENVKHTLLLSHLTNSQREDLIEKHIKNNIYDSKEYNMESPNKDFEDIWGGESPPQFLVVKYYGGLGTNYYLCDTQGYDYPKYVVRIDDLERWVNIEENLQ